MCGGWDYIARPALGWLVWDGLLLWCLGGCCGGGVVLGWCLVWVIFLRLDRSVVPLAKYCGGWGWGVLPVVGGMAASVAVRFFEKGA